MRIGPLRFELQRGFELFHGLLGVALILQRQRQIVMRIRVVGFKDQRLAVILNGLVPRLVARKLDGSLAVTLSCLRKGWRREQETQSQQKYQEPALFQKLRNWFHSGTS